ncbi:MAG TPA: recombinase family protein [Vicinamibacteria bacterium]
MKRKDRGQAIREGMARARSEGVPLGRPRAIPRPARDRILKLRAQGLGYQRIADQLNAWRIPTARGGPWRHSTVRAVLLQERDSPSGDPRGTG